MTVLLKSDVRKAIAKLHEPQKSKILSALECLSQDPPQGDIKSMANRDDYRLRVGNFRLLFRVCDDCILVTNIGLRGQIYKRGN